MLVSDVLGEVLHGGQNVALERLQKFLLPQLQNIKCPYKFGHLERGHLVLKAKELRDQSFQELRADSVGEDEPMHEKLDILEFKIFDVFRSLLFEFLHKSI